jgi:hypothetical protein
MIIHRKTGFTPLILFTTLIVFVVMIFALTVVLVGAVAVSAQATSGITSSSTPTSIAISFVGNTSPRAGIDHVSVAGITTYNNAATSNRDIEQKIITVYWGDGTISQSKITRISSSSEGKWGPLYHKYDSVTTPSNHYIIVAKMDASSSSSTSSSSSSSANKELIQIKSEPYLINVQKGPITVSSLSNSPRNNIGLVSKNNELTLNPISYWVTIIALSVIGSVTAYSVSMVRHRGISQKMILTLDRYKDKKQNHYTNTSTSSKSK